MNRATWLTERRAAIVATYDGLAREYDQHEYPSDTQREWVSRLAERLPVNSLVLSYVHRFDAVLTIDAMENVPPEDWPAVLANLHRALRAFELRRAIETGVITADHIHGEIGELVSGITTGRTDDAQITLYRSLGVAVQDAAAASLVLRAAQRGGVGTVLALEDMTAAAT